MLRSLFLVAALAPTVLVAQTLRLPGMVQVDDSTFIDAMEVSVADWSAAGLDDSLGRPVDDVLARLPYRHFLTGHEAPVRYSMVGPVRTRHGALTLGIDADSLRTKDQRYRAKRLMSYPITGITQAQAQRYCGHLVDVYTEELERAEAGDLVEVTFTLPDPGLLERLLTPRDSSNGTCALFNYACEPCQQAPTGRDAFIHPGREITPVDGYMPDLQGLYNLRGNVAEMTTAPGVAKGGSYAHTAKAALPGSTQRYDAPQPWLGFRCVARVRPL